MASVIIGFKQKFAYKANWFFSIFASLTSVLIQIALWNFLYFDNKDMINYMKGYVVYASVLNTLYTNRIYHILAGKILNGDFALDLIKPINIVWLSYLKSLGEIIAQFFLQTFPLIVFLLPVILKVTIWDKLGLYIAAVFLGHVLITTVYAIVGFAAFVFIDVWALRRLVEDTIKIMSGAMVPIFLFPAFLQKIAFFLPFHYLYDFPLMILLDPIVDISIIKSKFIGVAVWEVLLGILLYVVYRIATRYCVVQGG